MSVVISLELRDISKSFGARDIFSGINAKTGPGCLVVTGRNGSGKSTLLRIIAGLIAPTTGEVVLSLDGQQVPSERRRDVIGMVSPDLALYDELSALENLRFFARVRGICRTDDQLRSSLAQLGLEGREDDRIASYSFGMKQRVKYAFALMHQPPVLLFDEPSTNLDEEGIRAADSIITEHRRQGIVVLATNDQSELRYGDNVLELGGS